MTVVLETTRVGAAARDAVAIDERAPLGEAWHRLHGDPDRCGVIVRGHVPVAVVTAGDLAERWPGGGPVCSWSRPVGSVLDRPLGVETLDAADTVEHGARRVLASGLLALPFAPAEPGGSWQVLGLRGLVSALLEVRP
jgi:hypothetical protein